MGRERCSLYLRYWLRVNSLKPDGNFYLEQIKFVPTMRCPSRDVYRHWSILAGSPGGLDKEHRSAYHPCTATHQVIKTMSLSWGRAQSEQPVKFRTVTPLCPLAPFRTPRSLGLFTEEGHCQDTAHFYHQPCLRATSQKAFQNYLLILTSRLGLAKHMTEAGIKRTVLPVSSGESSTSRAWPLANQ